MTKAILTLTHSDEVSGMSIMDDGTKVYWTEGQGSNVTIARPDGHIEDVPFQSVPSIIADLPGDSPMRPMTTAEELEYELTRERNASREVLTEIMETSMEYLRG